LVACFVRFKVDKATKQFFGKTRCFRINYANLLVKEQVAKC